MRDEMHRQDAVSLPSGKGSEYQSPLSGEALINDLEAVRLQLRTNAQQEWPAAIAEPSSHADANQTGQEAQAQGMKRDLVQARNVCTNSQQELTTYLNQKQETLQRTLRDRAAFLGAQGLAAERQAHEILR